MWTRLFGLLWAVLMMGGSASLAWAQNAPVALTDPEKIIRQTVEDTLSIINQDKALMRSHQKLYDLVKTKLLPQFDAERITARVVGRDWLNADAQQKQSLINLFSDILMLSYSNALLNNEKVSPHYSVVWGRADLEEKRALVRSTIKINDKSYAFDYSLRLGNNGWKLDDLLINNLSLFSAYREQFRSILERGGNIEALIKKLAEDRAKFSL